MPLLACRVVANARQKAAPVSGTTHSQRAAAQQYPPEAVLSGTRLHEHC